MDFYLPILIGDSNWATIEAIEVFFLSFNSFWVEAIETFKSTFFVPSLLKSFHPMQLDGLMVILHQNDNSTSSEGDQEDVLWCLLDMSNENGTKRQML